MAEAGGGQFESDDKDPWPRSQCQSHIPEQQQLCGVERKKTHGVQEENDSEGTGPSISNGFDGKLSFSS